MMESTASTTEEESEIAPIRPIPTGEDENRGIPEHADLHFKF